MKAGDKVYTATVGGGGERDDGIHLPRVVVSEATVDIVGPGWAVVTGEAFGVPALEESFPMASLSVDRDGSVYKLAYRLEDQRTKVESYLDAIKDRMSTVSDWFRKFRMELKP